MATKKKTKKKTAKSKKTSKKSAAMKKVAKKKASAKKTTPKKLTKKKSASKKVAKAPKKRIREKEQIENPVARSAASARSGKQSGDFQGISRREAADSESVDELLEEGNTFEAGAVAGVEEADDDETAEVHTHEVLEDDVPQEYLDED